MATGKKRPSTMKPKKQKKVRLLSGGNPQIAMGEGEAPIRAYLSAAPGWKQTVGEQLDALITSAVPRVRKAVKWNSPFYGIDGQGWFLSFHCYTKFVRVAFFKGRALKPLPPGTSKQKEVRYLDVTEGTLDAAQFSSWVKQAASIPGWLA